ncbi:NAD(P)/FAD-dependent oxidoreductase [Kushneria sinocarnis]|uniref:NAD(P)/FAD-dependent oxidoreductase n=1 Tax=Kushneria sinocarnis TaxID=595502 RepID=UPI000EB2CA2F|nr:FAD-dependent oxidoreductase [Kushneria sinocarnis]
MSDIAIVGGGINGLLSALLLAERGASVVVVEQGACVREASWAGGGILSPLYPWRYDDAVTALASIAEPAWPGLAERLRLESGIDPQFSPHGIAHLRIEDPERAERWQHRSGRRLDLHRRAPLPHWPAGMTEAVTPATWMPAHGSIRTPRLGQALRARVMQHERITLHEHRPVTGLVRRADRVIGVATDTGPLMANNTVIAGGPWTRPLLAPLGIEVPIRPVRGQMLLLQGAPDVVDRVVLMGGDYLIPRRDGQVLVGSTFESCGFDKSTTRTARERLQASALAMAPGLAPASVVAHWAGLRPGSPHGVPFIGETSLPGLWLNAGHAGNGVVLAPASAQLLAELLGNESPCVDPTPYRCDGTALTARDEGPAATGRH